MDQAAVLHAPIRLGLGSQLLTAGDEIGRRRGVELVQTSLDIVPSASSRLLTSHGPHTPSIPATAQIGEGIDGYIIGGIGMAMAALTTDLHLSTLLQGLVGASPLIGIFVGGPLFGRFADRFGRRPVFLADTLIFLVGSVLQCEFPEAPRRARRPTPFALTAHGTWPPFRDGSDTRSWAPCTAPLGSGGRADRL
ncbi:MFS transporter [Streptomyces mirabilis]|uniref:MFS transporter n=1 Tax=Streptomyces mirabilis TaxID=68239 RepID=UPI0033B349B0